MFLVVGQLYRAAPFGLVNGLLHRIGDFVGIHNHLAVEVSGCATYGLYERAARAQESFLVCVEYGNEADFGQVETLAQQVHAYQHVEHPGAEVVENTDAVHGLDVRVDVGRLDFHLCEIVVELLGHTLGQGSDKGALAAFYAFVYFHHQVVDLVERRPYGDKGVEQPGRTDYLFHHHTLAFFQFEICRSGRYVDGLV